MTTVIHHNPACGTSRNVLAAIRATGTEPVVIEYLQTGWTRPQLLALFAAADLTPAGASGRAHPPPQPYRARKAKDLPFERAHGRGRR